MLCGWGKWRDGSFGSDGVGGLRICAVGGDGSELEVVGEEGGWCFFIGIFSSMMMLGKQVSEMEVKTILSMVVKFSQRVDQKTEILCVQMRKEQKDSRR